LKALLDEIGQASGTIPRWSKPGKLIPFRPRVDEAGRDDNAQAARWQSIRESSLALAKSLDARQMDGLREKGALSVTDLRPEQWGYVRRLFPDRMEAWTESQKTYLSLRFALEMQPGIAGKAYRVTMEWLRPVRGPLKKDSLIEYQGWESALPADFRVMGLARQGRQEQTPIETPGEAGPPGRILRVDELAGFVQKKWKKPLEVREPHQRRQIFLAGNMETLERAEVLQAITETTGLYAHEDPTATVIGPGEADREWQEHALSHLAFCEDLVQLSRSWLGPVGQHIDLASIVQGGPLWGNLPGAVQEILCERFVQLGESPSDPDVMLLRRLSRPHNLGAIRLRARPAMWVVLTDRRDYSIKVTLPTVTRWRLNQG
jgi:hypothetical protein